MLPATRDLELYRGDRAEVAFRIKENGEALDLTGYRSAAELRARPQHNPGDSEPLAAFETSIEDATDGRVRLELAPSVSAELPGECVYDLRLWSEGEPEHREVVARLTRARAVTTSQ